MILRRVDPSEVTRFRPWMCSRCGYLMDATAPADGPPQRPEQGDISVCMNCGMPYTLKGDAWRLMTAAELGCLTMEERRELALAQLAQSRAGFPDLAKRGGRA